MHFLSCRDESAKMSNSAVSPTKAGNYLGLHLDENLTFEAHVQSEFGKTANHESVVMRLRHFRKSSIVVRSYNILKPIIQYGLSIQLHDEKEIEGHTSATKVSTSNFSFSKTKDIRPTSYSNEAVQ